MRWVRCAQLMYRHAWSRVRVKWFYFVVLVGLHCGSVIIHLLLILVLETSPRWCHQDAQKLLYVDNLVLLSESLEGLKGNVEALSTGVEHWSRALEAKWLSVNVRKTKIMIRVKKREKFAEMMSVVTPSFVIF